MPGPPDYPPTHAPLPLDDLWDLADLVDARAEGGEIAPEALAAIAAEAGVPRAHAWAGASVDPELHVTRREAAAVEVCVGGCQAWGALDLVERLLALRDARLAEGRPAFDVIPRACLNVCELPPTVQTVGPSGPRLRPRTSPADLAGLVDGLLGED